VIAHLIKVTALPSKKTELVEFLRWDADVATSDEPGTLRFDVHEVPDEIDALYVYEAYASDEAFAAHREGAPFKKSVEHILPDVIAKMGFLSESASSVAANVRSV